MIRKGKELSKTKVDVANIEYKIDHNNLVRALEPLRKKMTMKKGMLIPIEKAQMGDNS